MTARQAPADRARRIARRVLAEVLGDLRARRLELGLSQAAVAAAVGISSSMYGRLERNEIDGPRPEDLWAIGAVLGLDLRLDAYPGGEPIGDRVQLPLPAAFRERLHPSIGWPTEVPLPIQGDRRAWDAVAIAPDGWTGIEAISRLGAIDATVRRANLKQRDDPRIGRVVLLVADTVRNRAAMRLGAAVLRADDPLETRTVMTSLGSGASPPMNGSWCSGCRGRSRGDRQSTIRPHRPQSRGWVRTKAPETRGQLRWWRRSRPVRLVLPEGADGGQGRRRSPQGRSEPGGGDHINATGAPPAVRSRSGLRSHQGPARGQVEDGGAPEPGRALRCRRWAAREGRPPAGARKDVTGIPVSVLLSGVEA